MASRYFPNFPMCAELTKFWSLTFLGGLKNIVLKIFLMMSTLLGRKHICKKHLTFRNIFEKVVNDKETNWHGVIMFS